MLGFDISRRQLGRAKEFLAYLVGNNVLLGTSRLSEVKILYAQFAVMPPDSFNEQFEHTLSQLSRNGGFMSAIGLDDADLITTAKIYRTQECTDKNELLQYLSRFIVGGYISPNDDISATDLRVYYNYFKLWTLTQEESANDITN